MNLFEKIFNYQIISRLDEAGSFAFTAQERSWLKAMLTNAASDEAFTPGTLNKLRQLLHDEDSTDIREVIIEKAKSREKHVYHPLLRTLRRIIMQDYGIRLTYRIKHGGVKSDLSGIPLKLEYNMVKREWYLLWYSTRNHSLMATRLETILSVEEMVMPADRVLALKVHATNLMEERKEYAIIDVVPTYNAELSRILYAFSCFDKSVSYDEESNLYRIRVQYPADESEFLLSKIRFLGLRVKISEGDHLKRRMMETASKALARYEEVNVGTE